MNQNPSQPTPAAATPAPADTASGRRKWLLTAGAALLGGVTGLVAWNRRASRPQQGPLNEPVAGFWAQQWQGLDGQSVPMAAFQGHPLLLNFWATWCPPCVEELPLIDAFYQQNKANGMQVLGLAIDKPAAVQAFLKQTPLSFTVAIAGLGGGEWGRSLGNLTGGLPFSVMVGSDGSVVQRKMGRLTPEDLAQWAGLK